MKPYYEDELCTLYHGDVKEVSAIVGHVQCCITDPPYGETSLEWDRWPKGWPDLIPSDSLWCFGSFRMFTAHWPEFDGWKLAQEIVWEKHNGTGFDTDRFKRVHETVVQFYRGKWKKVFKATPVSISERKRGSALRSHQAPHRGDIGSTRYHYGGTRITRSVIKAPSVRGGLHPTQKPEMIIEHLVRYSPEPGATIFDPFMGSGSVGVVAKKNGRRFIGCDADLKWCQIAAQRLAATPIPAAK